MVNLECNMDDVQRIQKIAKRANEKLGLPILGMELDLTAVHVNGCPLRLAELRDAKVPHFNHDIIGIVNNLNRTTGKLENDFRPRFAKDQ